MIEFVTFFGTSVTSSPHEIIDRKELVARAGAGLYPAFTHADIKACIDKIQPVRFREHIVRTCFADIYGVWPQCHTYSVDLTFLLLFLQ